MTYETGYYGIPGHIGGRVHVLKSNGKTMCGYRPHPLARFQWCAGRIEIEYIDCPRCKERAQKIVDREELRRLEIMHPRIYKRLTQTQSS